MPTHTVRILTDEEYTAAYRAASRSARTVPPRDVHTVLCAALAALDIAPPPPDIEPDTCPALFLPDERDGGPDDEADAYLQWQQCADEPGHDPDDGHDSGDVGWPDSETYKAP